MAEETKDSSIKLNEEKSLKKSKNNVKKQEQKAENDKIDDRRDSISMRTYKTSISTVESQVLTRQELPDGEESLKNSLIIVNKMVTEYIQIGFEKLIEEKFTPLYPNKKEGVVFVIPGFLGSITYYKPFMIHLYNELKLPIVGISHGDHCRPTLDIKQANVKSKDFKFMHNFWGQVHHKLVFLHHFIPTGVPIIIVAHSIGAAIALQMLRMNSNLTVTRVILLFPLIEHIKQSKSAIKYSNLISTYKYMIPFVAGLINQVAIPLQRIIISMIIHGFGRAVHCQDAASNFLHPLCVNAVTELFTSSIDTINEIDFETFDRYQNYISAFYGENDEWVNKLYYERLNSLFSSANIQMPFNGVQHLFYLDEHETKRVVHAVTYEIKEKFVNAALQLIPTLMKQDSKRITPRRDSFLKSE